MIDSPPVRIVLIAAGGHAAEVASYFGDLKVEAELLGAIDDNRPVGSWGSSRVLGGFGALQSIEGSLGFHVAVGQNALRRELAERARASAPAGKLHAATLRHRMTWVAANATIGEGSLLAPGSIVNARASVGKHVIINVKASVSHDSLVDDFVNLNPNATICGNARIGEGAYIGAGATVIEGVRVGAWSVVGAGAVVVHDLPDRVVAVGVPARPVKTLDGDAP